MFFHSLLTKVPDFSANLLDSTSKGPVDLNTFLILSNFLSNLSFNWCV